MSDRVVVFFVNGHQERVEIIRGNSALGKVAECKSLIIHRCSLVPRLLQATKAVRRPGNEANTGAIW